MTHLTSDQVGGKPPGLPPTWSEGQMGHMPLGWGQGWGQAARQPL